MRLGVKTAIGERLHDVRVTRDAILRQFAKRIIGPTRVAAITGPGMACDVEKHCLSNRID